MRRFALITASLLLAAPAFSQVEVVEPGGMPAYSAPAAPAPVQQTRRGQAQPAQGGGAGSGELFYQLQLLQDEVMKLRGIVEEQGEQLRQLKQQRLDDYISLDKRIGALGGGSAPPAAAPTGGAAAGGAAPVDASMPHTPPAGAPSARTAATPQEEQAYQAAYELVRARKFGEATAAFNSFVSQYPAGDYAGNAHYWLGELYLLDGDSASAKKHFETLLGQFGDNRRVPDAMFKLGRIYHQEGDTAKARDMLDRVANEYAGSDSTAPRLAREYLQQNF